MPLPPLHVFGNTARDLALGALNFVDEFEAEIVHAGAKLPDVLRKHVVRDDRRDGGKKSGRRSDQGFGDARCDGTQGCSSGGAKAVEGVDNAPNRSEEADEWSDRAGSGQPGQSAFESRQFFRCGNLDRALQGGYANRMRRLLAELAIRTFKYGDQRAGLELFRHGGDILQPLGLAKHADETVALGTRAPEHPPLREDDGPGDNAEYQQDNENGFGDETAGFDET